ncbi:MAG: DNA-directed RNA polymerase I subunit rpa49 [Chrysothrix sp. TS-e1954]|nr:MAG: DNA-directed RNA polymerase I subunit rpa49 [Chrysothrix sp. TS-e1954]
MSTPAATDKKRKRHSEHHVEGSSKKRKDANGITPRQKTTEVSRSDVATASNDAVSSEKDDARLSQIARDTNARNGTMSSTKRKKKDIEKPDNTAPSSTREAARQLDDATPRQRPQAAAAASDSTRKNQAKPKFSSVENRLKVTRINVDDEQAPIIAHSSGFRIPPQARFTPYIRRHPRQDTSLSQNTTSTNPSHSSRPSDVIIRATKAHVLLTYTGTSHERPEPTPRNHYVGVYDPKTHELEIIPARSVDVRSSLNEDKESKQESQEALKGAANLTAKQNLTVAFGSKKAKKKLDEDTQNNRLIGDAKKAAKETEKLKNEPGNKVMLSEIAQSSQQMPSKETSTAETQASKPRPAFDKDATDPMKVYDPERVIGSELLRSLRVKKWATAVAAGENVELTSAFCANRLHDLAQREDILGMKVLRYIYALLKLYTASTPPRGKVAGISGRRLPKKDELGIKMEIDDVEIVRAISRQFSDGKGNMTSFHTHLLISTVLALSLVVDGNLSDTHDLLINDLNLSTRDVGRYSAEIGAKLSKPTPKMQEKMKIKTAQALEHRMARIVLPLEFPRERVIPMKSGR